ncbi:TPA: hypothetical protein NGU98_004593 [Vibrio parahaemolyticus]|nr:hypothetical protein [Vibrio parahaemolyticus]
MCFSPPQNTKTNNKIMASDRNIRVSIYLTPEEQKQLANNFKIDLPISGQTKLKLFASCMRNAALNKKIKHKTTHPIARDQFSELARLAANLNQMMHAYHIGEIPDAQAASDLVKAIRNKLINISNQHESED